MRLAGSPPLTDPVDLRFRRSTLATGIWLTVAIGAAGAVYYALTWEVGHRPVLLALTSAATAVSLMVGLLPMERVIAGRWRETFFLGWTLAMVTTLVALGAIDPTRPSPLTLALFMPLLFSGMSYPLRSAMVASIAALGGYAGLALVRGADLAYDSFFLLSLSLTAAMCLWQASNRERQRLELDRHREELARASRVDPLTGALNRRGFEERLAAELAESGRCGRPLTIALLDLDEFKSVNDRAGHAAGDELLCETVARLTDRLRSTDPIGRLGGDEFALLLPGTGSGDAPAVVAMLGADVPASWGWSSFPEDGVDGEELVRAADESLYSAKGERRADRSSDSVELSWATAMADAIDRRMGVDHEHSVAVSGLAADVAGRLGWDERSIGLLRLAATLHDIGKVAVPDHILRKPGRLTADERREVERHAEIGAAIVARIEGLAAVVPWIRHSHEHFDGSGYPSGLVGEEIPLASRILLVADAFDAMTSDRSYRRALRVDVAIAELELHAGTQFDPVCVAVLVDDVRERAANC